MMLKSLISSFLVRFCRSIGNSYPITGSHAISHCENGTFNGINRINKAVNPVNALEIALLHVNRVRAAVFGVFFDCFSPHLIPYFSAITSIVACNFMEAAI